MSIPSAREIKRLREQWQYRGDKRPPFAVKPTSRQESVWDYPRPPRIEPSAKAVKVFAQNDLLAASHSAVRVLETSSPPVYYIPRTDIHIDALAKSATTSFCEWKGEAHYYSLHTDALAVDDVAWYYPKPLEGYAELKDYLAFYPAKVLCFVDGELVKPQKNAYYGGWITPEIVGPYKDEVDIS